jgi:hypothetical protein
MTHDRWSPQRPRYDTGQASVELVAVLPLIVLVGAVAVQFVLAGHALWMSSNAARVAARAAFVGGDARAAARSALPDSLEQGLEVTEGGSFVEVVLQLPLLVPSLHTPLPIAARAYLGELE